MANVQLEHGFTRVANTLDEALVHADFSGSQAKIVRCVIRLTYGWQQRTVRISTGDLAKKCGLANTGGFRRELDKLIVEGVIIEVERGHGRTPAAYALNKNFEQWGEYSVAAATLERLFGDRPLGSNRQPPQGQSSGGLSAPPEAGNGLGPTSVEPALSAPLGALSAPGESVECPNGGSQIPTSISSDNELDPPKERKTRKKAITTTRAREDDDAIAKYATGLATAANNAIAERWGEATRTRPIHWGSCTHPATEYIAIGIPLDVARDAIARACRASKLPKPPTSINYFDGPITDANKAVEQRALDAENPAPRAAKRGGVPQPVSQVVNREERDRTNALEQQFNRERSEAGAEWGKDPANATEYHAIVAAANTKHAGYLNSGWGKTARDIDVVVECAKRAGFPATFAEWQHGDSVLHTARGPE